MRSQCDAVAGRLTVPGLEDPWFGLAYGDIRYLDLGNVSDI